MGSAGQVVRQALHLAQQHQLALAEELVREGAGRADVEGDTARLLLAALLVAQDKFEAGFDLVRRIVPFTVLDRPAGSYAHLIGAAALQGLGRLGEAAHWCSVAAELAHSPKARVLEVAVWCLWAEVEVQLSRRDEGFARLKLALRRAMTPTEQFQAHLTTWRCWSGVDDDRSQYHLELATGLAHSPWQFHLLDERREFVPVVANVPAPAVMVHLLSGTALTVNGVRIAAERSPRATLLLGFLVLNNGETLDEVAAQILPAESSQKLPDKAAADRVARVRQHLNQARRLLGDHGAVVCQGGRLWLSSRYTWDCDLRQSVLEGRFDARYLLPTLLCPWLEELHYTAGQGHLR